MTLFTGTNIIAKAPASVHRRKRSWGAALIRQFLGLGPAPDDVRLIKVEATVQQLLRLSGVEEVTVICGGNLHEMTFEILSYTKGFEWVKLT